MISCYRSMDEILEIDRINLYKCIKERIHLACMIDISQILITSTKLNLFLTEDSSLINDDFMIIYNLYDR